MGAKVVGSLTPEVTGAPALDRIDRSAAACVITALSKGWELDCRFLATRVLLYNIYDYEF